MPGADADTALIPRALLEGPESAARAVGHTRASHQAWLGLLTVGAAAAALVTLAAHLKQRDDAAQPGVVAPAQARSSVVEAPEASVSPARRIRVESEPAGAHVVHRGAVIGSTPTDVPAPVAEELFLLRLPGHQTQLLQLSASSDPRIVVVMQPEPMRAAAEAPARSAP